MKSLESTLYFEFTHHEIVRYSDCDMHQHLNNARYLTFLEQARIRYFEALGMTIDATPQSIPVIIVHASVDYRAPALINDAIAIDVHAEKIGTKSVTLRYRLRRDTDHTLIADATTIMAWFDHEHHITVPVPDAIRKKIAALQCR